MPRPCSSAPARAPELLCRTRMALDCGTPGRAATIACERRTYVERLPGGPADYAAFLRETFGPLVALREALADDPARLAALDGDLDAYAERVNAGPPEGPFACPYEYLLVVARTG